MKKVLLAMFFVAFAVTPITSAASEAPLSKTIIEAVDVDTAGNMVVTSTGIRNGVIQDKYGGLGNQFNENGIPTYSMPFKIEHAPKGTVSFAIILEDKDAYPVTGGFVWIHWLAANITRNELKDNESQTAEDFIQGNNSWTSIQGNKQSKELSCYYGGMTPPDKAHVYELHVFALDKLLNLKKGFFINELYHEMEGHILDQYTLKGVYERVP